VPVLWQAAAGQSEDARSEVRTSYPGQDEEACVVDDEVKIA
jgi:hypothetical protein